MDKTRDREVQLVNKIISGDNLGHRQSFWWLASGIITGSCLGLHPVVSKRPLFLKKRSINAKCFSHYWNRSTCVVEHIILWQPLMKVIWCCRTILSKAVSLLVLILGTEEWAFCSPASDYRTHHKHAWLRINFCPWPQPSPISSYPMIFFFQKVHWKGYFIKQWLEFSVVQKIYMLLLFIVL